MVPPALSWMWKYEDDVEALWLTPLFHATWDSEGELQSSHLFPAYLWKRDAYWAAPALFSGSWKYADGSQTTWISPFFHVTTDDAGDVDSLHVGPYFQGRNYWAVPPLFSWHVRHANQSETTWLTPAFHLSLDGNGDLESLHVLPAWFWERDKYWAIPPLLIGGGTHDDGARTTWITPMFHYTENRRGEAESFHILPAAFWKRDDYWYVPLLLSGGSTRPDGSSIRWFSPLYHDEFDANGMLRSRHALTYIEGPTYNHVMPVFWDWTSHNSIHYTMVAPPLFVRSEEGDGRVTTSLPWPLITAHRGPSLDRSLGMELRPFLYQDAGEHYEFNFLWRMFSVLSDEEATRVMVGPLWYSTCPNKPDAMSKFQILGGLFARDVNYETERYRYRLLWFIPLGSTPIRE